MPRTTITGSQPRPAWLPETGKPWFAGRATRPAPADAKRDATILAIKPREDAEAAIVIAGAQSCHHFARDFLEPIEGIDVAN